MTKTGSTRYGSLAMRIIGGTFKGKRLSPLKGNRIPPTADRLREAIFNILSDQVRGATVLDLFSGTGALGIEALSRGATFAVLIDKYKNAVLLIEKNVRACACEERVKIIQWNIIKNLTCLAGFKQAFDLVFMDPPYRKIALPKTLMSLHTANSLKVGALLVIEHSLFEPLDLESGPFTITDQRKYGKTLVSFLSYML